MFHNTNRFQNLTFENKDNCRFYGACKKSFYYVTSILVALASYLVPVKEQIENPKQVRATGVKDTAVAYQELTFQNFYLAD